VTDLRTDPGIPEPTGHRVIIEQLPAEEKIGSIVLPEDAKEAPLAGRVIAMSRRVQSETQGLLILNDVVLFPRFGGCVVTYNKKKLLIMDWGDVLAIDDSARTPVE
jgi:chaperonin GroES